MPNNREFRTLTLFADAQLSIGETRQDGSVIVRGYFTTEKPAVGGVVITKSATEKAVIAYKQWGNIRFMHEARPVGRVLRIGTVDGLEWNEVEALIVDEEAIKLLKQNVLKAFSVGIFFYLDDVDFDDEGNLVVNNYVLAEISVVDHPANYGATINDVQFAMKQLVANFGVGTCADALNQVIQQEVQTMDEILETQNDEQLVEDEAPIEEIQEDAPTEEDEQAEEIEEQEPQDEPIEDEATEEPVEEVESVDVVNVLAQLTEAIGNVVERLDSMEESIKSLQEYEPEPQHKAAIPVEPEDEPEPPQEKVMSLRDALARRFNIPIENE